MYYNGGSKCVFSAESNVKLLSVDLSVPHVIGKGGMLVKHETYADDSRKILRKYLNNSITSRHDLICNSLKFYVCFCDLCNKSVMAGTA